MVTIQTNGISGAIRHVRGQLSVVLWQQAELAVSSCCDSSHALNLLASEIDLHNNGTAKRHKDKHLFERQNISLVRNRQTHIRCFANKVAEQVVDYHKELPGALLGQVHTLPGSDDTGPSA